MPAYEDFSKVYDELMDQVPYGEWCVFVRQVLETRGIREGLVADLGCGTGKLTQILAERGYNMIGIDLSEDMLAVARQKCDGERFAHPVLLVCQNMADFELYGTVQATICTYDCINYLLTTEDVGKCFSLVNNYTEKGGLFVFDINTPYRYNNVFADNAYVYEDEGGMLVWQNKFMKKRSLCDFYLTYFTPDEDGLYSRGDQVQRQRCYSLKTIEKLLTANGFEVCAVYGGVDMSPLKEDSEKAYFVAKSVSGRAQG